MAHFACFCASAIAASSTSVTSRAKPAVIAEGPVRVVAVGAVGADGTAGGLGVEAAERDHSGFEAAGG